MSEIKCSCGDRSPDPQATPGTTDRCETCGGALGDPVDDEFDLLAPFIEQTDAANDEMDKPPSQPADAGSSGPSSEPHASIATTTVAAGSSSDATAGVHAAVSALLSVVALSDPRRNAIALAVLFAITMLGYFGAGMTAACRGTELTQAQATGIDRQLTQDFSVATDDRPALRGDPLPQSQSPTAPE